MKDCACGLGWHLYMIDNRRWPVDKELAIVFLQIKSPLYKGGGWKTSPALSALLKGDGEALRRDFRHGADQTSV